MQIATGDAEEEFEQSDKDHAAQSMGRRGGKARAQKMTPEQRKDIARKAAKKGWQIQLQTILLASTKW